LFSISALATTMPILAIATYVVVFNLDRIAAFLRNMRHLAVKLPTTRISTSGEPRGPTTRWLPTFLVWIPTFVHSVATAVRGSFKQSQEEATATGLKEIFVKVQVDVESCGALGSNS